MNTKTALFKANVAIRLSINFVMAPCKWQLKATRHLICSSCSNWVDFVKSGCEKSWAEVQVDSFSFECRGRTRMKELEVELEQLRLLILAVVGREQVVCASGSGEGTVDKVGEEDERDARVSSPQPGRRLRGGKLTGCRETGRKEMGHRETGRKETRRKEMGGKTNGSKERGVGETVAKESGGGKEMIVKAMGVREMGRKATGVQVSQETGGKGDMLMRERESLITVCLQVTRLQDRL